MYEIYLSREAQRDRALLKQAGLEAKARELLALLAENPFATPPRCEKLVGNLDGFYSRRINIKHRLVYRVDQAKQMVYVLSMWSHYGD